MLRLAIDPLRITWTLAPLFDLEGQAQVPLAGDYPSTSVLFASLMDRWLSDLSIPINRLAFAGKLLQPTSDKNASNELLARYLPGVAFDENMSDFQYRVNRKRQISLSGGKEVNRLITWSAITLTFQVRFGVSGSSTEREIANEQPGCMLEFDVNTADEPRSELFELPGVLKELVSMTTEVTERGDAR
jgi:hypothetical protein